MPWREVSAMEQRLEFVTLALSEGANRRELCRRFGISAQTGYKWLRRWQDGAEGLCDRSRRPHGSPARTAAGVEAAILAVRDAHPAWGARKIARCLSRDGLAAPAPSTVHAVLQRHGRIGGGSGGDNHHYRRFEKPAPNLLWQMDFKGRVPLAGAGWCHPLTVIDDHSRYALCLAACGDQRTATVRSALEGAFCRYGLPEAFFLDNGSPWGGGVPGQWTPLGVWLLKLGVEVIHSRPYHPQSRGKNERFHRTLNAELLACNRFRDLACAQTAFNAWRTVYNTRRPHEALGQEVPATRYAVSPRPFTDPPPEIVYDDGETLRTVNQSANISFRNRLWRVPKAFRGERVAIRPRDRDGRFGVFFGARRIATIDVNNDENTNPETVSHVSEQASTFSPG